MCGGVSVWVGGCVGVDGWVVWWVVGWMDVCVFGRVCVGRWMVWWVVGWVDLCVYVWAGGWVDVWVGGSVDGWVVFIIDIQHAPLHRNTICFRVKYSQYGYIYSYLALMYNFFYFILIRKFYFRFSNVVRVAFWSSVHCIIN